MCDRRWNTAAHGVIYRRIHVNWIQFLEVCVINPGMSQSKCTNKIDEFPLLVVYKKKNTSEPSSLIDSQSIFTLWRYEWNCRWQDFDRTVFWQIRGQSGKSGILHYTYVVCLMLLNSTLDVNTIYWSASTNSIAGYIEHHVRMR